VLSTIAAVLASCGDEPADPRAVSAILPTRQASDVADEVVRNAAEATITDRCVRRHGFRPPSPPTVTDFSADAAAPTVQSSPYGPTTSEAFLQAVNVARNPGAYTHGGTSLAEVDANINKFTRSLGVLQQERYTAVVFGDENDPKAKVDLRGPGAGGGIAAIGGCLGVAYKTLYGSPAKWVIARELMGSLPRLVRRRVTDSEDYRAALSRWRACVRQRGIAAMSFTTAGKIAAQASPEKARAIAQTVTECRAQAGIDDIVRQEERKSAESVVKDYESDLLGYLEMVRRGTDKAREVLAQGTSGSAQ
jgi:hypothetical protein